MTKKTNSKRCEYWLIRFFLLRTMMMSWEDEAEEEAKNGTRIANQYKNVFFPTNRSVDDDNDENDGEWEEDL